MASVWQSDDERYMRERDVEPAVATCRVCLVRFADDEDVSPGARDGMCPECAAEHPDPDDPGPWGDVDDFYGD